MNIHKNARTTPQSRALLVHRVVREHWSVSAVAIGFIAIGRLVIGRAKIKRLEIGELRVTRLHVTDSIITPQQPR